MTELSLVIPIYNESKDLNKNIEEIQNHVIQLTEDYEIILVDDGSLDTSWHEICQLNHNNKTIRGIRLSRNFGKENALSAGLHHAQGELVLTMDSDLEHPPEVIRHMYHKICVENMDMVDGIKKHRGEGRSSTYNFFSGIFMKLFSNLAKIDIQNASDFRMFNRQVLDAINSCPEYSFFFRGISSWVGFQRGSVEFSVEERKSGKSKWTIFTLFRLAVNAITSYTSAPLHLVTGFGLIFGVFAIILGTQTLYNYATDTAVDGFTTVILLILISGAFLMMGLGIIGEYIARLYDQVKNRPRYIVKEKHE